MVVTYTLIKAVSFAVTVITTATLFGCVSVACQLRVGFYAKTCPSAESIVRKVVQDATADDPKIAAVLLRLQFHDCFVQGCDASILISTEHGELEAGGNLGVGGFEIVEDAKTQLEGVCPGVVSCADIVALAARDAVLSVKGPFYDVPTGRRDGRVSSVSLAADLPEVDDPIQILISKFNDKGLSDADLVLLSGGAHTIGLTACFFMQTRLYNFSSSGGSDPAINPLLLPQLQSKCPLGGDVNVKIPLDWGSELSFDDQILRNIKNGFAVIASDARLYDDDNTRRIIDSYLELGSSDFMADFAGAMVKMGNIQVKTGLQGEIRRHCRLVN